MNKAQLTFLGTGASGGVPVIGCSCPVCTSPLQKNKRLRTSAWIRYKNESYLIDVGPDIRQQALTHGINAVHGILITHGHYDHVGGLEEMRIFNFMQKKSIDCCLSEQAYDEIQKMFYYLFTGKSENDTFTSEFIFHILDTPTGACRLGQLPLRYFRYMQGNKVVLGVRIGSLAYLTDIKEYDPAIFEFLSGVRVAVIGVLRFSSARFHFTVDEAIDFIARANIPETYFVHMSHEIDHERVNALLPKGVHLAYDGLEIQFEVY